MPAACLATALEPVSTPPPGARIGIDLVTDCVGPAGRIRLHGQAAESAARLGTYEIAVTPRAACA